MGLSFTNPAQTNTLAVELDTFAPEGDALAPAEEKPED
jgi:hypothetical protein